MSPSDLLTNDEVLQDVQQEGNPEIVFTGPRGDLDVETERKMTMQQLYNLSPFVRQWVCVLLYFRLLCFIRFFASADFSLEIN